MTGSGEWRHSVDDYFGFGNFIGEEMLARIRQTSLYQSIEP